MGGGEIGVLHVVVLHRAKASLQPIDRIRYSQVDWLDDGSGFFYSRLREGYDTLPPAEKFGDRARYFRSLTGTGTDQGIQSPLDLGPQAADLCRGQCIFQIPANEPRRPSFTSASSAISPLMSRPSTKRWPAQHVAPSAGRG